MNLTIVLVIDVWWSDVVKNSNLAKITNWFFRKTVNYVETNLYYYHYLSESLYQYIWSFLNKQKINNCHEKFCLFFFPFIMNLETKPVHLSLIIFLFVDVWWSSVVINSGLKHIINHFFQKNCKTFETLLLTLHFNWIIVLVVDVWWSSVIINSDLAYH